MPSNPFKFGKIVYDKHFYNREKELQKIKATLSSGNNIALYAPRRYGKSSLIAKALNELEKEGYVCVHFDFMSVYSQKTFIENYSLLYSVPGTSDLGICNDQQHFTG